MERLRWRIMRVDGRLVRVLQYLEPGQRWRDIFSSELSDSLSQAMSGGAERQFPPGVVDLDEYRARRRARTTAA